ncbi:hypothetical protein B0T11DRAFT_346858 [Plectosphaerella cucumerina]|uniref:Uncharacterized protein n=1 Tax=Plectosphaerella cucumerina TaxID=40658 RepID=A0A8K0TTL2_9PEZI|nr:hypothetical protein B0T11DRAFT_346858 [Plectosphaerella cucumerina]
MKTTGILTIAVSALSLATSASAAPEKRQTNFNILPRSEATCCYDFGGGHLLIPTKGDGQFMSEGSWCFIDVKTDPKFPNDCEKATRSLGGGYCGDETFGVRDC